jgi:hypothetical protein
LDPYGWHKNGTSASYFVNFTQDLEAECQPFCHLQPKKWHGLAHMGAQELVWHCIITHWTHMDDMEWFSSIMISLTASRSSEQCVLC